MTNKTKCSFKNKDRTEPLPIYLFIKDFAHLSFILLNCNMWQKSYSYMYTEKICYFFKDNSESNQFIFRPLNFENRYLSFTIETNSVLRASFFSVLTIILSAKLYWMSKKLPLVCIATSLLNGLVPASLKDCILMRYSVPGLRLVSKWARTLGCRRVTFLNASLEWNGLW